MATSQEYTISRKVSDTEEEEVKVPSSAISGLATVATSGSYNDLANKPSIPDVSGKANLAGGNSWTGSQQFNQGGYWFATDTNHPFVVELENGDALVTVNQNGVTYDRDGLGTMPLLLNGNAGASGQVLTSQGTGITPVWSDVSYDKITGTPDLSVYALKADIPSGVVVEQTTGQSTTSVMSQKAVTDELDGKATVEQLSNVVEAVQNMLDSTLAPQENGKLSKKFYVYPDGSLASGTVYDASKDMYLSIGDGLTLEAIDKANNIYNIKSASAITSVDGLGGGTISGNVSTTGSLTVSGNLTVNGTTTTVDSTTLQVKDKLIEVAHGNTTKLTTPAGLVAPKYDGTNSGALVFDGDGTAYVGDVTLDSNGNIDVSKSGLQPLATRTGLVGGNLVQYDSTAQTLKDSGKKIGDLATTSAVNAKYTKPSGGIPKTDLASDVQTSLGKADSALQSHQDISGKANLAGGNTFSGTQVINGFLDIRGTAADKHLKTRGIGGSDGNGTSSDLYLQYSSDFKTVFGKTGNSSLNADGSVTIGGKKAATTDQIPDISGKQDTLSTAQMAAANSGITAAKVTKYDGYESTINGKQAAITASNKLSASLVSGLATVATSGSYNDLADKPAIPSAVTSIDGLAGGELTSPLVISGGDQATAHKIALNQAGNGQITDSSTSTIFGFMSNSQLTVGGNSYSLNLRGSGTRPTYKGADMALKSDIPDVSGKQDKLTAGSNISISGNTISATVPTKTSQLTNDSGYATTSQIPDVSGKANLSGGNVFQGKQEFEDIMLTSEISSVSPHRVFNNSDDMLAYIENPGSAYKYTSQTVSAFIANTDANNRTVLVDGRIDNKKSGTSYKLTLPQKEGTLAVTSDIPTKTSQLTNDSNFVKSNTGAFTGNVTADNFNSRFSLQSVPYGTAVGANADLNTTTYLKVGNYYCSADNTVATQTNVPTSRAYMMTVYSPLGTHNIDQEATATWVYRVRKLMTYTGDEYIQYVYSGGTAGSFTYNSWQQIAHKSDVPTFSLAGTTLTITT